MSDATTTPKVDRPALQIQHTREYLEDIAIIAFQLSEARNALGFERWDELLELLQKITASAEICREFHNSRKPTIQ